MRLILSENKSDCLPARPFRILIGLGMVLFEIWLLWSGRYTPQNATKKAQQKTQAESKYTFFVSSDVENAAFDVRVGPDATRINGVWDENRSYVTWKCPTEFADAMKLHHHVWSGRIIPVED